MKQSSPKKKAPPKFGAEYKPLAFRGFDSMSSLYLWSDWRLAVSEAFDVGALVSLQTALFALIVRELGWQQVVVTCRHNRKAKALEAIAVWKLPPGDPGTAYLNGINIISTWDEYAALSEHILSWNANLYRSSGFGPARTEDLPMEVGPSGSPAAMEPMTPFKEDLIIVTVPNRGEATGRSAPGSSASAAGKVAEVESADVRMQYLTVSAYKQRNVTGRFSDVETLAKNGVIQATVTAENDLGNKPFRFINLSGLQERTRWL